MPWLLETTAWDPVTSAVVPIYASHDLRVPILNGADYEGRLAAPPAWGEAVSDSALVQGGRATTSYGALVLILSGGAEHWWRYNWVGRTVTIRRGAQGAAYGAYTTDLVAEVAGAARSRSGSQHRLVLTLQGLASKIAQPSPATRYAGTGGIEGGADLLDQPVLQIYGVVRNVTPDLVSKPLRIYRLHDRAINAVTAVYDKGRALTPAANYADFAALAGATVPQGSYATSLAYGLVRLGAEPEGRVTVDAQGDAVGGYVSTAATIFARLAARAGISGGAIDSAAISAVDAAAPFGYALAIRSADITYADLFDRCAQALGAVWRVTRLNVLSLTRLVSAASSGSLALSPIDTALDDLTPPRLVRVSHGHNWTVQTEDELGIVAASAVDGLGDLATRNAGGQLLPDTYFDPAWWAYSAGMTRVTGASISASFPAPFGLKIVPGGAGEAFPERAGAAPAPIAIMACQPGQRLHGGVHLTYNGAPEDGSLGLIIRAFNTAGGFLGTVASGYFAKSPGARFEKISGVTPAGSAFATLVLARQSSMTTGEWYVGAPYLGYAETGATEGAPAGTTIAGTLSEDVEGAIANLSPATGRALASFLSTSGLPFSKIAAVGEARDGDVVTFPTTLSAVPKITFLPGGNAASAGQNIAIQPVGLSASGFTMKAKSQSVTAGSTITDTGAIAGGAGEPDLVINRSNSGAPFDGKFIFSVTVSVSNVAPGEPGYVGLSVAVKKSGAWVGVGAAGFSQSGTYTVTITPGTVDFGAGAEFGVDVNFVEGASGLTAFNSVKYTLGTVSETSLTPTGASSIPWIALLDS